MRIHISTNIFELSPYIILLSLIQTVIRPLSLINSCVYHCIIRPVDFDWNGWNNCKWMQELKDIYIYWHKIRSKINFIITIYRSILPITFNAFCIAASRQWWLSDSRHSIRVPTLLMDLFQCLDFELIIIPRLYYLCNYWVYNLQIYIQLSIY